MNRRSNPVESRGAGAAVAAGLAGAVVVAVVDGVLTRFVSLNETPAARAAARLAVGAGARLLLARAGAPDSVADGALAGPVLVTALDVGVTLVGRRGIEPPRPANVAVSGLPWPPSPRYALGAG